MIGQAAWVERKFHFDFPVGLFPVIYSRMEGSIFRLKNILSNPDEGSTSFQSGGWSVKEHIGHLTDLEELWWRRLEDFKSGKAELSAADMSNEKTHSARHNDKTIEHLLAGFAAERQRLLETVYWFDEDFLARTAIHPRLKQPMRVVDSLYFVAEHDDHHIAKIQSLLYSDL